MNPRGLALLTMTLGMALGPLASACSLLATPIPASPSTELVGIWVETRRVVADGTASTPSDPLRIGFFPDGTFKAVLESHQFETYHDFWGEWRVENGTLTLRITGGNNLPVQSTYEGDYQLQTEELVLEGITLVDDFAGPTTIFSRLGPAPEDGIVP